MSDQEKTAKEYASDPDVQEFVAKVTGQAAEESLAKFEEKLLAANGEKAIVDPVEAQEVQEVQETPAVPAPAKKASAKEKYAAPVAVSIQEIEDSKPQPAGPAVVSNNALDDVILSKIIYKNIHARKSLSVHHLQRRLVELGYADASRDKDGYYGDLTKHAVAQFQATNKLEVTGMVSMTLLQTLFKGDPNVRVIE